MVLSTTRLLCERLQQATLHLDQGDVIAAATDLAQLTDLYTTLPRSIPESDLAEVRNLYVQCTTAGEKQRVLLTEALRTIGAGRRGMIYR